MGPRGSRINLDCRESRAYDGREMHLSGPRRIALLAGVAGLLVAGGLRLTLEAQQPPAGRAVRRPPRTSRSWIGPACTCHDNATRRRGCRSRRSRRTMSPSIPTCGRKSSGSCARGRCRRSAKERPDEATYDAVIASLETSLDRAAAAHPNPGRTATIRRLTRTEYQNADPRSARARRRRRRRCCRPTSPATASTT